MNKLYTKRNVAIAHVVVAIAVILGAILSRVPSPAPPRRAPEPCHPAWKCPGPTPSPTPTPTTGQLPYGGTAAAIPGTVQAENFDTGGQNVSWNDLTTGNNCDTGANTYRANVDPDIKASGEGGYAVGCTQQGEWLEYTINVSAASNYDLNLRIGSKYTGNTVTVTFNDVLKATVSVPQLPAFDQYQTVTTTINLAAGVQVMRVTFAAVNQGIDYQWASLATSGSPSPSPTPTPPPVIGVGPQPNSCSGTNVPAGADIQTYINNAGNSTTFCLAATTYRLTAPLSPKTGDSIVGQPGTILNGSRLLTSWTQSGSIWYTSTPIAQSAGSSVGCLGTTTCELNEDVLKNDAFMVRKTSSGAVVPGSYYIDYAADRIYVGDSPSYNKFEVSILDRAFNNYIANYLASSVSIKHLVVEKFASPGQGAAVNDSDGTGWLFQNLEVRLNHSIGLGLNFGPSTARNNFIHHNGEMGVYGKRDKETFDSNEISYNAPAVIGYNVFNEGGGSKFVATTNLVVQNNYAHDNRGPGLWADGENTGFRIEGNRAENNTDAGILTEISCNGIVHANTVTGNGFDRPSNDSYYGGGIVNWQSPYIEVYGNTVYNNKHEITGLQTDRGSSTQCGTYNLTGFNVHDNKIKQSVDGRAGVIAAWTGSGLFHNNTYCLDSLSANRFYYNTGYETWAQWQASGQESGGTAVLLASCPF